MIRESLRALFALCVLGALTGCAALHESMHELADHYKAARTHAEAEAYAEAEIEIDKVQTIVVSDDVAKANSDARFVELHRQLVANLTDLGSALPSKDAERTAALFEETTETCRACHKDFR